jgi:hypothetical protein
LEKSDAAAASHQPVAPLWRAAEDDLDAAALLSADGDGVERWQPCVAEAVAAHPARKLVLFDGKIVVRDGTFLAAPIRIAGEAVT